MNFTAAAAIQSVKPLRDFRNRQMAKAAQEAERANSRADILVALDGSLTFSRRERLARLLSEAEARALAGLVDETDSVHTLRAIATDLEAVVIWHRKDRGEDLPWPPSPALIDQWLSDALAQTPCPSSATLKRRLTSWARMVRAMGADEAVFEDAVPRARTASPSLQEAPRPQTLGEEGLANLIETCPTDHLTGLRDRALLLTAFTLGLGPGALAALKVNDFAGDDAGGFRILRHRKPALPLPTPAADALRQWLEKAGLVAGPLFRPVDRWMKPGRLGLTPQSVKLIVKARAKQAGLDPARVSARSLR